MITIRFIRLSGFIYPKKSQRLTLKYWICARFILLPRRQGRPRRPNRERYRNED